MSQSTRQESTQRIKKEQDLKPTLRDLRALTGPCGPMHPPRYLSSPFPWPRTSFQLSPGPLVHAPVTSPASLSLYCCLYLLGWSRPVVLTSLLLMGPVGAIAVTTCPALFTPQCGQEATPTSHSRSQPLVLSLRELPAHRAPRQPLTNTAYLVFSISQIRIVTYRLGSSALLLLVYNKILPYLSIKTTQMPIKLQWEEVLKIRLKSWQFGSSIFPQVIPMHWKCNKC